MLRAVARRGADPGMHTATMEPTAADHTPSRDVRRDTRQRMRELGGMLDAWGAADHSPGDGPPPGEWDGLLGPIIALLATGRPPEEIAARITTELRGYYGLVGARDDVAFATKLRHWWDGDDAAV